MSVAIETPIVIDNNNSIVEPGTETVSTTDNANPIVNNAPAETPATDNSNAAAAVIPELDADGYYIRGGGPKFGPVAAGKTRLLISGAEKSGKKTIQKLIEDNISANGLLHELGYSSESIDLVAKNVHDFYYGGRSRRLALWNKWVPSTSGLIFMIDSTGKEDLGYRMKKNFLGKKKYTYSEDNYKWITIDLTKQLASLNSENDTNPVPLLIFSIKQNEKNSLTNDELYKLLELDINNDKSKRAIHIESLGCNGEGLKQGMQWLAKQLNLHTPKHNNFIDNNNVIEQQIEGQIYNKQLNDQALINIKQDKYVIVEKPKKIGFFKRFFQAVF